jgi:hypothetical protein
MVKISALLVLLISPLAALAQTAPPPALSAIRESDLKRDLYAIADGHFNGRSAGTLDELKAAAWAAEQYRAIGLEPAGDDGTYFQFFTLWRNVLSPRSSIVINGVTQELWQDVVVAQLANVTLDAPVVYLGAAAQLDLSTVPVAGKVVAIEADPKIYDPTMSLPTWRYSRNMMINYGVPLLRRGAAGIIFIADSLGERSWTDATENFKRGQYDIEGGPREDANATAPILWVHASAKPSLQDNHGTIRAHLIVAKYPYPSVNLIGKVTGTDAHLKSEYVRYSGHIDAHGIRNPIKGDTVYHGADDNGSVDVAIFAAARAFRQSPAKRSVLFVIHGAEERGLLGSEYYVAHPTVPLDQIVAVLNGDMIGRNDPASAALLGSLPPHRDSSDLVAMALAANQEGPAFTVDTSWDKVSHPEGWYFRSDHLPYARKGVPAIMFTTLLHPDYHTPQDSAENIDYPKLKKMAEWMYRAGWKVAEAPERPGADKDFHLER